MVGEEEMVVMGNGRYTRGKMRETNLKHSMSTAGEDTNAKKLVQIRSIFRDG